MGRQKTAQTDQGRQQFLLNMLQQMAVTYVVQVAESSAAAH